MARWVIVRPLEEAIACQIGPLYGAIGRSMARLCAQYGDEELALVLQFLQESIAIIKEETARLREGDGSS